MTLTVLSNVDQYKALLSDFSDININSMTIICDNPALYSFLKANNILLPAENTINRLISSERKKARKHIFEILQIENNPSHNQSQGNSPAYPCKIRHVGKGFSDKCAERG